MKTYCTLFTLATILFITSCRSEEKKYYRFMENGDLIRPTDYRSWMFVGSAATPKSLDSSAVFPDFQNIYIDPESYQFWKENGYYREGTIFAKELMREGDSLSHIGRGFYQGDFYSLAFTIKDTVRFPYAKGGWEYFDFTNFETLLLDETSAVLGVKGECFSCHNVNKDGQGPYTEFYPILLDAKNYGKGNPESKSERAGLDDTVKEFAGVD